MSNQNKPIIVIADGQGMAREKNPHPQNYWCSPETMKGHVNPAWLAFDKEHLPLPIYKNGKLWMGKGEVLVDEIWQFGLAENPAKEFINADEVYYTLANGFNEFEQTYSNVRRIYEVIPEAQEAEANTLEAYLRSEIQGHDHERWFEIMLEGAKIGAKWARLPGAKESEEFDIVDTVRNHVGEGGDYVGDWFAKIYKEYKGNPYVEVKNFDNNDMRLSLLKIDDKTVAMVVENRTEFNNCEYVFCCNSFERFNKDNQINQL